MSEVLARFAHDAPDLALTFARFFGLAAIGFAIGVALWQGVVWSVFYFNKWRNSQ